MKCSVSNECTNVKPSSKPFWHNAQAPILGSFILLLILIIHYDEKGEYVDKISILNWRGIVSHELGNSYLELRVA